MRLTETRFVTIDGTNVTAAVNSPREAKAAVKELRHKKREYAHLKRALQKARRKADSEARAPKPGRKGRQPSAVEQVRGFFGRLSSAAGALKRANAEQDLVLIERELKKTDEILHNIDTVLLQIEGKLLHQAYAGGWERCGRSGPNAIAGIDARQWRL